MELLSQARGTGDRHLTSLRARSLSCTTYMLEDQRTKLEERSSNCKKDALYTDKNHVMD